MSDPRSTPEHSHEPRPRTPRAIWIFAALFVVAGVLHFAVPAPYVRIVPAIFPAPLLLVYVSGAFELLGGIGLLVPAVRRWAGIGLIVLLTLVLPANVQMLRNAQASGAEAWWIAALVLRLPLQPLLAWWIWRVAIRRKPAKR